MGDIKNLNSTAVYAWTTLISVLICVPAALIMEGPRLRVAVDALANSHPNFYLDLFIVGLLYHLYNQVHQSSDHVCWTGCGRAVPFRLFSCGHRHDIAYLWEGTM